MAYDESLYMRVHAILARRKGIEEKRMFGGIAFMASGNMACALNEGELCVRLGVDDAAIAAKERGVRIMDITKTPMKSYVVVSKARIADDDELREWVLRGLKFARSLPAK